MQASGGQELYYPLLAHCLVTSEHLVSGLYEHGRTFIVLQLPVDVHLTGRGVPCQPLETADPPELGGHRCSSCRGPVKQAHFCPLSQSILGSGWLCGLIVSL